MNDFPTRRTVGAGLVGAAAAATGGAQAQPLVDQRAQIDLLTQVTRIAFGSCNNQRLPQTHWAAIRAVRPDALILTGDNVYGDLEGEGPSHLAAAYAELARNAEFHSFRGEIPILATWDDHDYGANDRGGAYIHRRDAQEQFLNFWGAPPNDPRRSREGVYDAHIIGPPGRRVQIIMLDLRSFRGEMVRGYDLHRNSAGYAIQLNPTAPMLGEAQWVWLEQELRRPAEVRLLISSLQVIGDGGENWKHLPFERRRLFALIASTGATGLICLSGDVHTGAMYRFNRNLPYPFYEFTSSSLNQGPQRVVMDEAYLIEGGVFPDSNFGIVKLDWDRRVIDVALHALDGGIVRRRMIDFSELKIA